MVVLKQTMHYNFITIKLYRWNTSIRLYVLVSVLIETAATCECVLHCIINNDHLPVGRPDLELRFLPWRIVCYMVIHSSCLYIPIFNSWSVHKAQLQVIHDVKQSRGPILNNLWAFTELILKWYCTIHYSLLSYLMVVWPYTY